MKQSNRKDVVNQRFGKLLVRSNAGKNAKGLPLIECLCDCGNVKTLVKYNVTSGNTKSCGCLWLASVQKSRYSKVPGVTKTNEYRIWKGMIARCEHVNNPKYRRYGGRGIQVCDRWRNSFDVFLEDLGPRPSKLYSLDRIDNDGNYEPGNCRWATAKEQANNKFNCSIQAERYIELKQKEQMLDTYINIYGDITVFDEVQTLALESLRVGGKEFHVAHNHAKVGAIPTPAKTSRARGYDVACKFQR